MVEQLDTVLGKALAILRAFGPTDTVLPLTELVRRSGLSKGTVHRIAGALAAQGMLNKGPHGYRLSRGLFELGMRASTERTLLEMAFPFLQDLYERSHETVHLGVLEAHEVVYLTKLGSHRPAASPSRTGGRMPLHCTAIGKVLLAHADPKIQREVLAGPLERLTPRSIVAPGLLKRQLDNALETGLAYENEESRLGLRCIAAPVLDPEGRTAVAALSIAGPVGRFTPEDYAVPLRATAAALAAALAARRFTP